jgi:hypothetical protein
MRKEAYPIFKPMNIYIHRTLLVLIGVASLIFSFSALADDPTPDMLNQALDLVHQAWNPGGDAPSNAQRTDLLTRALKLAQQAPDRHLKMHRAQAIQDIDLALAEIQKGDPDQKATGYIRDADSELRSALSIAQ